MLKKPLHLVFQFLIEIKYSDPKIWRRIQVPTDFNFEQLHDCIQTVFAWQNSHLHAFYVPQLDQDIMDVVQFSPIYEDFDHDFGLDETKHILQDYLKVGDSFKYQYDFGDDWIHQIVVEGLLIREKKLKYPRCIDGAHHAPFEDIGGIFAYEQALAILKDPKHHEYTDLVSWLKETIGTAKFNKFDPHFFDPNKVKFKK